MPAKMIWIGRSGSFSSRQMQVHVGHEQVGPLVGGEAAGQADRENVGVEQVARGFDHGIALAAAAALPADAAAHEGQEQILERVVNFPQFARIDPMDALPVVGLAHAGQPADGKIAIVELQHLAGEPTGHVYAVGDMADGDFFFDAPRPEVGPHPPRDVSVQAAHRVGTARELQPQHGHAEAFAFVVRLDAPQPHQLFVGDAQLVAQRAQVLFDQSAVKAVVAGGHGRVGGEDGVAGHFAQGAVEAQAVVLHPLANGLERGRTRCALR